MTATDDLDDFYADTVAVETKTGTDAWTTNYAASIDVLGLLKNGNQLVRNAAGVEVVSTAQFTTRPEKAALFTPESRVTIGTRKTKVITVTSTSPGSLDLPAHCRVTFE